MDDILFIHDRSDSRCGPQNPCAFGFGCPNWDTAPAVVKVRWGREEETVEGFGLPIAIFSVVGNTETEARRNMRKHFTWVRTTEPFPWPFYVRLAVWFMLCFRRVRVDIYALLFKEVCAKLLLRGSGDSGESGEPGDVLDWSIETVETGHSSAIGSQPPCYGKRDSATDKDAPTFFDRVRKDEGRVETESFGSESPTNGRRNAT